MTNKVEKETKWSKMIDNQHVAVFDHDNDVFYSFLVKNNAKQVDFYKKAISPKTFKGIIYSSINQIYNCDADVCFLDGYSIKSMLGRFPKRPKYVFVRITLHNSWFFGLLGLLNSTVIKNNLIINSIVHFKSLKHYWIIIERKKKAINKSECLSLSPEVGVLGFIKWLNKENISYVVLRFYEKLPEIHRLGGDLDILVDDPDEEKVISFLKMSATKSVASNEQNIPVDVWPVNGIRSGDIPYYPPKLAKTIIQNSTTGPANARIPNSNDAFLSFAYHCLYHKGFKAGIPSKHSQGSSDFNKFVPENDYLGALKNLAQNDGIKIDFTMESIDDYLAEKGWRPMLDTLSKISFKNEWVKKRFFSTESIKEKGLVVFLLKEKAEELGIIDKVVSFVEKKGFKIIRTKKFSSAEKVEATNKLRGGVWSYDNLSGLLPAFAVVAQDKYNLPYLAAHIENGGKNKKIKKIKQDIRNKFDKSDYSIIHSTDNTLEALEYIEVCFPDEFEEIKKETFNTISANKAFVFTEKAKLLWYMLKFLPYKIKITIPLLKARIINSLSK